MTTKWNCFRYRRQHSRQGRMSNLTASKSCWLTSALAVLLPLSLLSSPCFDTNTWQPHRKDEAKVTFVGSGGPSLFLTSKMPFPRSRPVDGRTTRFHGGPSVPSPRQVSRLDVCRSSFCHMGYRTYSMLYGCKYFRADSPLLELESEPRHCLKVVDLFSSFIGSTLPERSSQTIIDVVSRTSWRSSWASFTSLLARSVMHDSDMQKDELALPGNYKTSPNPEYGAATSEYLSESKCNSLHAWYNCFTDSNLRLVHIGNNQFHAYVGRSKDCQMGIWELLSNGMLVSQKNVQCAHFCCFIPNVIEFSRSDSLFGRKVVRQS